MQQPAKMTQPYTVAMAFESGFSTGKTIKEKRAVPENKSSSSPAENGPSQQ